MSGRAAVVAAAAVVAVGGVIVGPPLLSGAVSSSTICYLGAGSGPVQGLDAEQSANARTIVSSGRSLGVSEQGLVVALATAAQESTLRNLTYGDRDSLGLFQQRPSAGWGAPAQLTDPEYASRAFFGGRGGPNYPDPPGLIDMPGWEAMTVTQAAQAVQRSAYPDAYAAWEDDARVWLGSINAGLPIAPDVPGGTVGCGTGLSGDDGDPVVPDIGALQARAAAFAEASAAGAPDPFFGDASYYRWCARLAARIHGYPSSGYATAMDQWRAYASAGITHPGDLAPPPGALMFYSTGDPAGHVAVYLGGNQVTSNDVLDNQSGRRGGVYIVGSEELTNGAWHLTYLGWAPPMYTTR